MRRRARQLGLDRLGLGRQLDRHLENLRQLSRHGGLSGHRKLSLDRELRLDEKLRLDGKLGLGDGRHRLQGLHLNLRGLNCGLRQRRRRRAGGAFALGATTCSLFAVTFALLGSAFVFLS